MEFETRCKALVNSLHASAEELNALAIMARTVIGGKLVAKEFDEAANALYILENHLIVEVLEID